MRVQMVSRARAKPSLSKLSRTSPMAFCVSFARASSCGLKAAGLGIFPAKFFSISAAVRLARIPGPFARAVFCAGDKGVVAEIAVLAEDDVAQEEITERVHAEHVDDRARENDVAFGLAHFGG